MKVGELYILNTNLIFIRGDLYPHRIPTKSIVLLLLYELRDGEFETIFKAKRNACHIFIKVLYDNKILTRCFYQDLPNKLHPLEKMVEKYFHQNFGSLK